MLCVVALFAVSSWALCTVTDPTCYVDNAQRILGSQAVDNGADGLYNEYCAQLCHDAGFALAGTEDSDECYCGNALRPGAQQGSGCDMQCWNWPNETCGGSWRLSVFAVNCSGLPQPPPPEIPRLINPCVSPAFARLPFCNASLSLEDRITDALGRMTADEKIGALGTSWPAVAGMGLRSYDWWSEVGVQRSLQSDASFLPFFFFFFSGDPRSGLLPGRRQDAGGDQLCLPHHDGHVL